MDERQLAREAWHSPIAMQIYVDHCLSNGLIIEQDVSCYHIDSQKSFQFHKLETDTRRRILKLLKIKADIIERPIWNPKHGFTFAPDSNWKWHCITYVFLVKKNSTSSFNERILLQPQPMMLGRDPILPDWTQFLDSIFAQIMPRKTSYNEVLAWIRSGFPCKHLNKDRATYDINLCLKCQYRGYES